MVDLQRGVANLQSLASFAGALSGEPTTESSSGSLLHSIAALAFSELDQHLSGCVDPDRALNNLERVVSAHGWESLSGFSGRFIDLPDSSPSSSAVSVNHKQLLANTKLSPGIETIPAFRGQRIDMRYDHSLDD